MFNLGQTIINVLVCLFSGVVAVYLTFPLLASWFGVTITITGAGPVAGMYLYLLSTIIVVLGISLVAWIGILLVIFAIAQAVDKK